MKLVVLFALLNCAIAQQLTLISPGQGFRLEQGQKFSMEIGYNSYSQRLDYIASAFSLVRTNVTASTYCLGARDWNSTKIEVPKGSGFMGANRFNLTAPTGIVSDFYLLLVRTFCIVGASAEPWIINTTINTQIPPEQPRSSALKSSA